MSEVLSPLEGVVEAVLDSAKYRRIDAALVRTLARRELAGGARPKDAIKAVKNKLHQVAGAYQAEPLRAEMWLEQVRQAREHGEDLRPLCRAMMARHASTRERLPILYDFYRQLFDGLPSPRALLDLACGLNPLALPWMGLAADCIYWACDIYADQAGLIGDWFAATGQAGEAFLCDLLSGPPNRAADVALLLKTIPCLQQVERDIGRRLLEEIDAPLLIVSYPVHSLGGRKPGMDRHYAAEFTELVAGRPWRVDTLRFTTELVYRIWK